MAALGKSCWVCAIGLILLTGEKSLGQVHQALGSRQQADELATPALRYFGRGLQAPVMRAPVTRSQKRRQAPTARPYRLAGGKPFQNLENGPTVTPYLGLDTLESGVGLPNYYLRVLPQQQQQQANQSQAAELRRLQQQVRLANAPGAISNNRNGGVPTTGRSSQFMNVGNYFPAAR